MLSRIISGGQTGFRLIFRLTPGGLRLPRVVTARLAAISFSTLSSQALRCLGGDSAGGLQAALQDPHGVDERKTLSGLVRSGYGLRHQSSHGGMRQHRRSQAALESEIEDAA